MEFKLEALGLRPTPVLVHTPFVRCPICSNICTHDGLQEHIRAHSAAPTTTRRKGELRGRPTLTSNLPCETDLLGIAVLKALELGQKYRAHPAHVSCCAGCHKRVILLPVSRQADKAFDVSAKLIIEGSHVCTGEARQTSIRTFSGGAPDSNRRRH